MAVMLAGEKVDVYLDGTYTPEASKKYGKALLEAAASAEQAVEKRKAAEMVPNSLWYDAAKPQNHYYVSSRDVFGRTDEQVWSLARGTHAPRNYWESTGVRFERVKLFQDGFAAPRFVSSSGTIVVR